MKKDNGKTGWDAKWAKRQGRHDRIRDISKAGALIAVEIDRLQRNIKNVN